MQINERKYGVILTYINIFLNTVVMLFFTPFVIRVLGQSEFGLYSLALSIINYLLILDFGFGNAVIVFTSKFLAKKEAEKQKILYGTVFSVYLAMSFLAIIIGLIFHSKIEYIFSNSMTLSEIETLKTLVLILIFNVAVTLPCNIFTSILNAYEKFIFIRLISILRTIITPFVLVTLLLLGYKSVTMILAITLLNMLYFLVIIIYYKKHIKISINIFKFKFSVLKIVASYSIFIFIEMVVYQLNWNSGQFILALNLGTSEVSIYSIAVLIGSTFMILSSAVSSVLLPKMSSMEAQNSSSEAFTEEMIKVGRLQAYIILLILTGFILFGKEFIRVWAGKAYLDAYYLSIIILIPLSIPLVQNLAISILQAKNLYYLRAGTTAIAALLNLIVALILVRIYGYFGIAVSFSASIFICYGVLLNFIYKKRIDIDIAKFWKAICKLALPLLLFFLLFFIFKICISNMINSFASFVLAIIYMLLFFMVSYRFSMNLYERNIINTLNSKILRKLA
ncbi:oligosaccharide flippase family protein [Campylobacter sputorum]|uniref:oligosaccharide flippase family protein n=1 Tax=Campylobacter sputorum TaxID=206 RepID=UPI000B77E243|nr:oligosaccharide flippase family protein [Campylobacter sputorum]ASM37286.1 flippase [Campylobacter sputorum bv. faecalis CCUG 20703]